MRILFSARRNCSLEQEENISAEQLADELKRYKLLLSFSEGRESRFREILGKVLVGLDEQTRTSDPDNILGTLSEYLRQLIPFEHLQLFVFHEQVWDPVFSSCSEFDPPILTHGSLIRRIVLTEDISVLYSPKEVPEFSSLPAKIARFYSSVLLLSCSFNDSIYLVLLISSEANRLDINAKKLARRFRPLIVNAVQRYHICSGMNNEIFEVTNRYHRHLEKIAKFVHVSNIAYWCTDREGHFRRDAEMVEALNLSPHLRGLSDTLYGMKVTDLPSIYEVSTDLRPQGRLRTVGEMFENRENIYRYVTPVTFMGQDYYLCFYGEPIQNSSGEFEGYMGTFFDISAEIKMMQTLEGAKRISEEVSRSKSQFLAVMSHEIKTPMQAIVGILDLLELTELTEEQRTLINHVSHSANLLQILLKDILDYSRMGSNEMQLEELEFSVRFVMDSIIKQMLPKAREQGISLELEVSSNFPNIIVGDQNRLSQVIFNLLGNAIKFTQFGTVRLKAFVLKNKTLRFEISDTGIGISPEKIEMLFNPFRQVDASMTRRFGGTGLGLAICKKIIELMNGTIGVESTLGKGSTFWFVIPERLPARNTGLINAKSIVKTKPGQNEDRKYRILLVEDSQVNQFIIKKMLENLGHTVTLANNGIEAVEQVQREVPDLVLMDLQMPEMNGIEASRRIIRYNPLVVILALTANASQTERIECRDAGMVDIVSKPVTIATLKNMFQTFRGLINEKMDLRTENASRKGFTDNAGKSS
jgi:signal transduction histidine kinase/AmiR/NasT family two-component response regulator